MRIRTRQTLLVALLLVVLVELLLHGWGDRLGEPRYWYSPTAEAHVGEMDLVAASGTSSDLVLAGSSMVQFGLLPEAFEEQLQTVDAAHNVGVPKGYTTVMERWLLEEVLRRLRPTRVVWGLSSLDFNGGRPTPALDEYDDARATAPGVFGFLDRILWRVSMTSRYRELIREPTLSDLLQSPPGEGEARPVEELLSPEIWPALEQNERTLGDLRSSLLFDFHIGPHHAAAFMATLEALMSQGMEVMLVVLPVSQPYVDAHPGGEAGYNEWVEWIEAEAARLGVPLFDHGRDIAEERFLDFNHIDETGAVTLSALVAADLAGAGW